MLSWLSIRWRLTIFHTAVILVVAVFILGILMVVTVRGVQTSVEEAVERRAVQIARLLEAEPQPADATLAALVDEGFLLIVRDANGEVLIEIDENPARYDELDVAERDALWRDVADNGTPATTQVRELYGYAVSVDGSQSDAEIVEVWRSYDEAVNDLVPFLEIVTFAIPGVVLVAIGGSWLMARSAMRPVKDIVEKARRIGEHDLSERLPVERPRDELGQLAATMNALLARLEVAFRQREEALAQQRQFVADASHELRTPLTSIEGYARLLRQWGAEDPEVLRESVGVIERESVRMRHMVESLLDLAHGDVGYALDIAVHDLREVTDDAIAAARMTAEGRIGVFAELPDTPVVVEIDRERIYQVLGILLDNALKYTPAGGRITVSVRAGDATAEIAVRDTGVGIDPGHLPHIFERFYRADASRTTSGSGLGLAIAKQIVEQHGGTIAVESAPGEGSIFTVKLPVRPENNA